MTDEAERRKGLSGLESSVILMGQSLKDNTADTKRILVILEGNGGVGLKTQVELNKQSIGRSWWFLGGISLAIMGAAVWIIRGAIAG